GLELFHAFREALGEPLPLIAEDLGEITDDVHELRRDAGLPSMKVLQFGFTEPQTIHAPHHLEEPTLVYTGTHDNDTAVGWYGSLSKAERRRIATYLGGDGEDIHRDLVRAAFTSVARWAVVPVQDVLGLGKEARMNTPGVADGNWSWRLEALPTAADANWVKELVTLSDRLATQDGAES
ncbi:MAG: 4-alpha-glucanotransferase, partial [Acidobacteriota bacterium]